MSETVNPVAHKNDATQKAAEILKSIGESVEADRVKKMAESKTGMKYKENSPDNKLTDEKSEPTKQPERVTQKAAEMFNTNRTIYNAANHF